MSLHLGAVMRHQILAAGGEEIIDIIPGRADQRNSASERFKHADGRDTRKRSYVRFSRDMDGHQITPEYPGRLVIRQPSAVLDAVIAKHSARSFRISYTVNARAKPQFPNRIEKELLQLNRAFLI